MPDIIKEELKEKINQIETNGTFIKSKLNNFIKYCRDILVSKTNLNKREELNKSLNELEKIPITNFIQIVILEFSPYKSNPSAYVLKMLADNELNKTDLKDEEYNKLSKYITCFIEICS